MLPSVWFLTSLAATLVPPIICDYQLEVNLISYNNSARRLEDGSCCDLENGGMCFQQDTCDVRFTFEVRNLNTQMPFNSQTKVFGPYENTDMISFPSCSTLMSTSNTAVRNPLTFIIPSNQWNAMQVLRMQAGIVDTDRDPITGGPVQESILSTSSGTIVDIRRPSAPNATFTNVRTFSGPNSLTLTYQYRIICSTGACGSDCSQTTNCQPFSSCTPVTPPTCADSPCQNGGTCSNVQGGGYTCRCPTLCDSQNCAICDNPCTVGANPCFNGGTCDAQGIEFTCTCRPGFTGDRCLDIVPVTTASVTSAAVTDSNLPTPDGTDTTVNQIPSTDSSIFNPDSSQNDATMKAVDGTNAGVVAVASWTGALMLLSGLLLLFMS